ncbi:WYL domain-containing protein [Streptomyces sp. NPDC057702]|uniref:WYL domain-containing protein n=1 Tax=Streptomyces sp. NPDC057702 TaxID=3346221 RepID=UPI0036B97C13
MTGHPTTRGRRAGSHGAGRRRAGRLPRRGRVAWSRTGWPSGRGAGTRSPGPRPGRLGRLPRGPRHPRPAPAARFTPRAPPSTDPAPFVTGGLDRGDVPDPWPCRGVVPLDAPATVIARWAPGGARAEEVGANRCRLTLGAWSWTGLAALIGTFGSDIAVVGPPELAAACATLARRYAAASRSTPPPDPDPS